MHETMDIASIIRFIDAQSPSTKVYLGADSERFKRNGVWVADYTLAVVVHFDGLHGCKIFGEVQSEVVYDKHAGRPVMRLMTEVYKVSELYLKLADCLVDRHVEIHLDINPNELHASSLVAQQAIGYIRGVCGMTPQLKPEAFAASYCADRLKEIMEHARQREDILAVTYAGV